MTKVAIVIGHSPKSSGAVGSAGESEFTFNNELMVDVISSEDLSSDINTQMFYRDTYVRGYSNQMIDLHSRVDTWGADVSIEVHFNGSSNPNVNGHEVLYCSERGKTVALLFDKEFDDNLPNRDRNLKKVSLKDNGGGFCCRGKSVSVLLEPFFASHQHLYTKDGEERQNLINAIVNTLNQL